MATNRNKIEVVIEAKDKASAKLKKTADNMVSLGKKMSIGLTLPFVLLTKSLIETASEAEETQSKFDTVFRGMTAEANAWAIQFSNDVGRATKDIKAFSAGMADVLKPMGLSTELAAEMSQKMVQLALDVASFNNKQDADVIRAFTSALTGERESLKTLGIVITEADVKQEAYTAGLVKLGAELTKEAKAQATINLLFKNSKDAQGDLIRTSKSFANQSKKLTSQLTNLKETIGSDLLPVATRLVQSLSKMTEWFGKLEDAERSAIFKFSAMVAGIGPVLFITGKLTSGIIALRIAQQAATISSFRLSAALTTSLGPIGLIAAALTGLATLVSKRLNFQYDEAIKRNQRLGEEATIAAQKLRDARKPIEEITTAIEEMGDKAKETTDKIKNLEEELTRTIKDNSEKQQTFREDLAQAYVEQEEKVADLIKQLKEKQAEVNQAAEKESAMAELQILQDQLAKEQTALDEHQRMKVGLYPEIVEERRKAELTEFELRVETLMKVRAKELEAFNQKIALMQQELAELKKNKSEMLSVEQQYTDKLAEEEDSRAEKTESTTQRILNSMSKRLSFMGGSLGFDTGGATTPSTLFRASGGPVRAGGSYVVGERGPELFTPGQYGKIGNSGGGGITINIQGNEFLGEEGIAERIGNSIMQSLKNTVKL